MTRRTSARTVGTPSLAFYSLLGLATTLVAASTVGLRVNLTNSIPLGLYRVIADTARLRRGDIVLVCLPGGIGALAHSRGYVPRGSGCRNGLAPVGKFVLALPGDTVAVSQAGLAVNGIEVPQSRPLRRDGSGRALTAVRLGQYPVLPRSLWLVGSSNRSFDSRYIGAVSISNVIARVRPL